MVKKLLSWILLGAVLWSLYTPVQAAPKVVLLEGIDVSYAQKEIDWETVAKHVDFVIIRCGYGQDRTSQDDEYWFRNVEACTRLGIPFGVYLYSHADTDAKARSEANHVLRLLKGYHPTFPVFIDIEEEAKEVAACSAEEILRHVTIFCEIIAAAGYTPGVYSNANWWSTRLSSPEYQKWERWVAQWGPAPNSVRPYCAWQYTNKGTIPGIDGYVDKDYWYGFQVNRECSHNYTSTITKAPTCTEAGVKRYSCTLCNHKYEEAIPATGHRMETSTVPPTCTTPGSTTFLCTSCGLSSQESLPPKGHSFEETIIPPTCATDGSKILTCTNCGYIQREPIPAEGHTVTETTVPPTCTTPGSRIFTCNTCGHIYREEIPAKGHSFVESIAPPTCTVPGKKTQTCTACGLITEEPIPAPGHIVTETVLSPTCTTPGSRVFACSNCELVYQETIPPTGHSFSNDLIPPTCTESGTNKVLCTNCGYSYSEVLPATGHSLTNRLFPPTCTEDGVNKVSCANCDYHYEEVLPATGHNFTETVVPPTNGQSGYTIFTCACGYSYVSDETHCSNHVSDGGVITKAPTETECGEKVYHCVNCGSLLGTEILPPLGDHGAQCPSAAFTDVPPYQHWAHAGIDFCVKQGLFRGVSDTHFDPDGVMTRAMLVTVLWRFEGCPAASRPCDFADVEPGSWYADAVAWAQETALVKGVGQNYFDPMGEVTREQFATILYRRRATEADAAVSESLLFSFPDAAAVSPYAKVPLAWAVSKGYINGTANNGSVYLNPQGYVTRAQAATILQRLAQS